MKRGKCFVGGFTDSLNVPTKGKSKEPWVKAVVTNPVPGDLPS